jgi:ribonucleoside-diphosphate reductase alpha chain
MKTRFFDWMTPVSREYLKSGYLVNGQDPIERVRVIADAAEKILGINGFADKFFNYMSRGWFSLSSPIWSNFGLARGLPISCYGSYVGDSIKEILESSLEVGMMSKVGGGTSGYFGDIRPRGSNIKDNGTTNGSYPFLKIFETNMQVISQGSSRRGYFAGYQEIDHPDIIEWLNIKTEGNDLQSIHYGVCVGDQWMNEMIGGDEDKRKIWAKVIKSRKETGLPYIFFKDNVNNNGPKAYKDKNIKIKSSNLCSEITLPVSEDESFVCDLSSMNLVFYDEWKDTDAVQTLIYFLDAVMTEFIEKASKIPYLERAVKFARRHRALGLGVLGWHDLLMAKGIPMESIQASSLNKMVFKFIRQSADEASRNLAILFGEPEMCDGLGVRNTTLLAIAPTLSSSMIMGDVSPGIEPRMSNYYIQNRAKSMNIYKNPHLEKILEERGENKKETWDSIKKRDGSVQHLDCLTEDEKGTFKTYLEINPMTLIKLAADRQKFIDQSQSLNLIISPYSTAKYVNSILIEAWKSGIKTLYYQHNLNAAQDFSRKVDCVACDG